MLYSFWFLDWQLLQKSYKNGRNQFQIFATVRLLSLSYSGCLKLLTILQITFKFGCSSSNTLTQVYILSFSVSVQISSYKVVYDNMLH